MAAGSVHGIEGVLDPSLGLREGETQGLSFLSLQGTTVRIRN